MAWWNKDMISIISGSLAVVSSIAASDSAKESYTMNPWKKQANDPKVNKKAIPKGYEKYLKKGIENQKNFLFY